MKVVLFCLLSFSLLVCAGIKAQNCTCNALMPIRLQPRGIEKNKLQDNFSKYSLNTISIYDIYKWQDHYNNITSGISWNPNSIKSKRRVATPEDSIYVLKGYLWFVHKIGFDCDYHIEIGDKDSAATRIIVEVPYTNPAVQKKIKEHLDSLALPIMGCNEKNEKKAHFTKGLPVLVYGFGFYDSFHKVNKSHGDEHTKKYLWEIHPVTDIVFLNE
ncbi:MAG: hypothetical protein ACJ748_11885 [Flavisolibacter sp.]